MSRPPPWLVALALWVAYLPGPVRTSARDNIATQLVTESLLSGRGFDLSAYYPRPLPQLPEVRWSGERLVSKFPVVHAVVSLPVAIAVRALWPSLEPEERSRLTGRGAGALFTALALALTYSVLLRLTSGAAALALTASAAFASPLYSVASRELWNHGPAALLLAGLLATWRGPRGGSRASLFAASACLATIYFVRHATLLPGLLLFLTLHAKQLDGPGRKGFWLAAFAGLAAAALPLGLLNLAVTGNPIGSYAPRQIFEYTWGWPKLEALLAYAFAPARSLLLFAPIVVLAAVGLHRASRGAEARLAWACAGALATALFEIACYGPWWGGLAFGPRMLAEYVPLLAILAAFCGPRVILLGCALCLPAGLLHGGYVFKGGHTWDERRQVDRYPSAIWDFRDSPVTDLLFGPPKPDLARLDPASLVLPEGTHEIRAGRPSPWLVHGWEALEGGGAWAVGEETWLAFRLPRPGRFRLSLSAAAPVVAGQPQRLELRFEAERAASTHLFRSGLWDYETVRVEVPDQPGLLLLRIRPAHIWWPGHGDVRRCTFYVRALTLQEVAG